MTIDTLGCCFANSSSALSKGNKGAVRSRAVLSLLSSTSVAGTCNNKRNVEKNIKNVGLFNFDGNTCWLEGYPIAD